MFMLALCLSCSQSSYVDSILRENTNRQETQFFGPTDLESLVLGELKTYIDLIFCQNDC